MPARRAVRKAAMAALLFIPTVDCLETPSAIHIAAEDLTRRAAGIQNNPILERGITAPAGEGSHGGVTFPPLSEVDTDHDDKVSRGELSKWVVKHNDEMFTKVDTDNDGSLTAEEYNNWGLQHVPRDFKETVINVATQTNKFWTALWNSVGMILATEIGDKTFFIAAILAMRHGQGVVFTGALSALAVMTILSVCIGFVLPSILPREYTHYCAILLFFYFGLKLLWEAQQMIRKGEGKGPSEELEEAELELAAKGLVESKHDDEDASLEEGKHNIKESLPINQKLLHILSQAFVLTFLAEWGDRSQIATIALASDKDPLGVVLGAVFGHSICTGVACVGGKYLAAKITERTVMLTGGCLFIIFGLHSLIAGTD